MSIAALFCGAVISLLPLSQLALLSAAAVSLVVIVITLAEPALGLAMTLFAAPFGPLENIMLGLPVESGQLLLALTLAAWLTRMLYRREFRLRPGVLLWPLLAFIAVAVLSFFAARSFELWAKECVKWAEILAVYVLVATEVKLRPHTLRIFIGAILISTLFEAALGIFQFGLRGEGPDEFAIMGGRFYRSYGTLEQPNPFGGYMGLTWPFAAGIALWAWHLLSRGARGPGSGGAGESKSTHSPQHPRTLAPSLPSTLAPLLYALGATIIAGLALIALVLSWSRGAWLGVAAAAATMFIMAIRKPLASLGIVTVIVLLVVTFNLTDLLPTSITDRLTSFTAELTTLDVRGVNVNDANYSVIERLAHWQAAQNMMLDRPYLGVGFGNYDAAYEQYRAMNWPNALGHAHNYYLNIFAETGILGFVAFLTLWGVILVRTIHLTKDRRQRPVETGLRRSSFVLDRSVAPYLALGLLGAWVHLGVHQVFDSLYVANIFLLIGVYLGLLDGMAHQSAVEQQSISRTK
jgi:O-antigen ligase